MAKDPRQQDNIRPPFGSSREERSLLMAAIKNRDTKPELLLRHTLWQSGLRYRVNYRKLPGKPDVVIKKYKLAIFVDGEFWHGYNWEEKKAKIHTNRDFWIPKIERNIFISPKRTGYLYFVTQTK